MSKDIALMSFVAGRVGSEAAQHVLADRGLANNGRLGNLMDPLIQLAFNPKLHRSVWKRLIREPFEIHLVIALSTRHNLDDEQVTALLEDDRRMVKQGLFQSGMGFISKELGEKVLASGVVTPSLAHHWLGGMTNEAWIPEELIAPVSLIESGERMVKNIIDYPELFSNELVIERITGEFGKKLKHYQKSDLLKSRRELIPLAAELGLKESDLSLLAAVADVLLLTTSKQAPVLTADCYSSLLKYAFAILENAPTKEMQGLACSIVSSFYINPNLPKAAAELTKELHGRVRSWEWAELRQGDDDWHLKARTKLMTRIPKQEVGVDPKEKSKNARLYRLSLDSKGFAKIGTDQFEREIELPVDRYGAAGWELLFSMAEGWESSFGELLATVLATLQR